MRYSFATTVEEVRVTDQADEYGFDSLSQLIYQPKLITTLQLQGLGRNGFSADMILDPEQPETRGILSFLQRDFERARQTKYQLYYPLIVTIETPE